MTDNLEVQLVNELRDLLRPLNEKYKDFLHVNLITLCDMKDLACEVCAESEQKCLRCVIGYENRITVEEIKNTIKELLCAKCVDCVNGVEDKE